MRIPLEAMRFRDNSVNAKQVTKRITDVGSFVPHMERINVSSSLPSQVKITKGTRMAGMKTPGRLVDKLRR